MRERDVKLRLAERLRAEGFMNLTVRILTPLGRLRLHVLYLGEHEIWHQAPNGTMPQRISSLKEALGRD